MFIMKPKKGPPEKKNGRSSRLALSQARVRCGLRSASNSKKAPDRVGRDRADDASLERFVG